MRALCEFMHTRHVPQCSNKGSRSDLPRDGAIILARRLSGLATPWCVDLAHNYKCHMFLTSPKLGLSSASQAFVTASRVSSWPTTQQEDSSALQGPYYQRTAWIEGALMNGSIAPGSEHHMHHDVYGINVNNWPGYVDNYTGPPQGW